MLNLFHVLMVYVFFIRLNGFLICFYKIYKNQVLILPLITFQFKFDFWILIVLFNIIQLNVMSKDNIHNSIFTLKSNLNFFEIGIITPFSAFFLNSRFNITQLYIAVNLK